MSEAVRGKRQAPSGQNAAPRHSENLEHLVAPLEFTLQLLAPNGTRQEILNAFDNRTTWHTIRDWRRGRRHVAPWAIELLKSKHGALGAAIDRIKIGPGQSAGWRNVAGYAANR